MAHMRGARSWAQRARDFTYYFGLLPPGRHLWRHVPRFLRDARAYRNASAASDPFSFMWSETQPMLADFGAPGLTFVRGNVCQLTGFASNSVESLSCLHAVEHIGLGRYGDPIDPAGWLAALRECSRVLAPGGRLYLGTPIGRERLNFNSGRVFSPPTIVAAVPSLQLASFSAVNDDGRLIEPAEPSAFTSAEYSCGLFEFTKP